MKLGGKPPALISTKTNTTFYTISCNQRTDMNELIYNILSVYHHLIMPYQHVFPSQLNPEQQWRCSATVCVCACCHIDVCFDMQSNLKLGSHIPLVREITHFRVVTKAGKNVKHYYTAEVPTPLTNFFYTKTPTYIDGQRTCQVEKEILILKRNKMIIYTQRKFNLKKVNNSTSLSFTFFLTTYLLMKKCKTLVFTSHFFCIQLLMLICSSQTQTNVLGNT